MSRYWMWTPIIALALAGCTTTHQVVSPQDRPERASVSKDRAIVLERSVWIKAENGAAGPFSYEIASRTKVLTFAALKRRKVAATLPPESELVSFEGRTMQPDGSVDKAGSDAAQVREGQLFFELPQPAVDAVLEYKYKIRCRAPLQFFYWQFQRGIPVVFSELTVSWPRTSKLGYHFVNIPSGQPIEPDMAPSKSSMARTHWSFYDLMARLPAAGRFAVVVGPAELLTEENRESGVGWGTGFGQLDNYLPRTAPPNFGKDGP